MTSSWVTHHLQGHAELIDFLTKFVMGVAIKNVGENPRKGQGLAFSALTSLRLAELVHDVFCHLLKLLNVFSHVIEGKDADQKLSKASSFMHHLEYSMGFAGRTFRMYQVCVCTRVDTKQQSFFFFF